MSRLKLAALVALLVLACIAAMFFVFVWPLTPSRTMSSTSRALLEDPSSRLTVYSLFPFPVESGLVPRELRTAPKMDGFPIIGTARIIDRAEKAELIRSIELGIANGDPEPNTCVYQPRHALIAERNHSAVELVICYTCGDVGHEYRWRGFHIYSDPLKTSPSPVKEFNGVLKRAGVEIAPDDEAIIEARDGKSHR